ncbi:hypothetical protein ANN_07022 [Periplaneta americana]|uniref:Uncharacterized protein n=1 Tax=Periplaneta americana TaxID=6978 RepID=A0ABQ8TGH9_PERAM|nr:hypothetical protein ANN_07022 [Periplaneta americana]
MAGLCEGGNEPPGSLKARHLPNRIHKLLAARSVHYIKTSITRGGLLDPTFRLLWTGNPYMQMKLPTELGTLTTTSPAAFYGGIT